MLSGELLRSLRSTPFQPFRLILTDGACFDIRHPELLWVGRWTVYVGLTDEPGETLFDESVKVDLDHITRIEPLPRKKSAKKNGHA